MLQINFNLDTTGHNSENVVMKTERRIRIKFGRMKSKVFVREQYLRTDIPCQSDLCPEGCKNVSKIALLSSYATHYLIPCTDIVEKYLEILESPELIDILFMQTCVRELGKRHLNRISAKIRDKSNQCIYFPNEFNFFTYKERDSNETCSDWETRNIYSAAVWYYNHLGGNMPVVLVTENKQIINEYASRTAEVFVLSLGEYLVTFWPNLTTIHELYFSLKASLADNPEIKNDEKDYSEYLSQEILQSGITTGKFIQGKLKVNKYHAQQEAYVSRSSSDLKHEMMDILISGMKNRNRAIHEDIVVVQILPRSEWTGKIQTLNEGIKEDTSTEQFSEPVPNGKVVGILQRCWRNYVATVPPDDSNESSSSRRPGESILVIPYDYRIPKIRIVTRQVDTLTNKRIIVRIDSWSLSSQYPNGHFVQTIGPIGDLDTETTVLLIENGVSTSPFPSGIMSEMPNSDWTVPDSEIKDRKDIRSTHLIFSIDPKSCEDVDDALSIKQLPNGKWELGVHIADVTHFVALNSLTDLEARNRSTTVYLADRRFDMLPRVLNSNICSLLSSVDRYAVSVFWELNSNDEVTKVNFARTIIKSAYQLSYEVAQEIVYKKNYKDLQGDIIEFENLNGNEKKSKYSELRQSILKLVEIGRSLKSRRVTAGAVELESIEVSFLFRGTKGFQGKGEIPKEIRTKESLEVHETIAECMIFANQWVAKTIYENFPRQALLRRHPPPKQDHFKDLKTCATVKGFTIDTTSNKALATSLNKSFDPNDPVTNNLLRQLATRAMSSAEYFSSGESDHPSFCHYGLGLDFYTHFTSPIRRYADVLVHRLLLAFINKNEQVSHLLGGADLSEVCQHINTKHKAAQDIQKASQLLFQTLYFLDKKNDDEDTLVDAIIFSIRANGVLVYVPRYGIKGPVYLKNKDNQVAFYINKNVEWIAGSLQNQNTSLIIKTNFEPQEYKLFQHITVRICVIPSHAHAHSFRLELVSNCPLVTDFKRGQDAQLPQNLINLSEQDSAQVQNGDYSASTTSINNSTSSEMLKNDNLHNLLIHLRELSLNYLKID